MKQGRNISFSTKGNTDDASLVRQWIERFFMDDGGKIRNNLSGAIKQAIIVCAYPHLGLTFDPRYVMPDKNNIQKEQPRREDNAITNPVLDSL